MLLLLLLLVAYDDVVDAPPDATMTLKTPMPIANRIGIRIRIQVRVQVLDFVRLRFNGVQCRGATHQPLSWAGGSMSSLQPLFLAFFSLEKRTIFFFSFFSPFFQCTYTHTLDTHTTCPHTHSHTGTHWYAR